MAFGYFDRSIEKQEVGDANPMTKKKKERKSVVDEVRKVKFRDDALVADAKSRFSHIVDEINLDADEFIQAIKDAISAEKKSSASDTIKKSTKKKTPKVEEPVEEIEEVAEETIDEAPFDLEEDIVGETFEDELEEEAITPVDKEALSAIRTAFKEADADAKAKVKAILGNYGGKLASEMKPGDVIAIQKILDI